MYLYLSRKSDDKVRGIIDTQWNNNLGVAHGIAGIGIVLCLAYKNGIKAKYQREAIDKIITIYKKMN